EGAGAIGPIATWKITNPDDRYKTEAMAHRAAGVDVGSVDRKRADRPREKPGFRIAVPAAHEPVIGGGFANLVTLGGEQCAANLVLFGHTGQRVRRIGAPNGGQKEAVQ